MRLVTRLIHPQINLPVNFSIHQDMTYHPANYTPFNYNKMKLISM